MNDICYTSPPYCVTQGICGETDGNLVLRGSSASHLCWSCSSVSLAASVLLFLTWQHSFQLKPIYNLFNLGNFKDEYLEPVIFYLDLNSKRLDSR